MVVALVSERRAARNHNKVLLIIVIHHPHHHHPYHHSPHPHSPVPPMSAAAAADAAAAAAAFPELSPTAALTALVLAASEVRSSLIITRVRSLSPNLYLSACQPPSPNSTQNLCIPLFFSAQINQTSLRSCYLTHCDL